MSKDLELLSVEHLLRKDSGRYGVRGMIVGISSVEHVIISTEFGCSVCMKMKTAKPKRKEKEKGMGEKEKKERKIGGSYERIHDPPLFSLPHDLRLNKNNKCPECESQSFGPKSHIEKAVVRIQLQDESRQDNLESLTVVLFESDTLGIRNGEKISVVGEVKVIQQYSKNSRRVSYLFAKEGTLRYERRENRQITISKKDLKLMEKFSQQPDYIKKLGKMFAPTIIGEEIKKLGVIVMYVGAPETEDFRGRIHGLFVGPPGTAKSKLTLQAKQLGSPNSRYSSMEGSSGQSLGVIIDKEGDSYVARSGILVQAKGSMVILNEVGALSEEDQRQLFSVMEEGFIPKDKYGQHKEIEAKTTVLGTTNPRQSGWYNDVISKDQIPLRRELIDRYDLIFVFKEESDKAEREKYARQKLVILQRTLKGEINPEQDYIFLRKIIQQAKTFNPTEFTEEAESMLIQFYSNLNTTRFPTRRVFDVATRVSMVFARLHFSEIVTGEIAKKALDYLTELFKEFDDTIVVIEDPRELVCREIADFYFTRPNVPYDFNDIVQSVKNRSSMLETYLGDGMGLDTQSHKFRALRDRFLESPPVVEGLIMIESHNPLRLVFRPESLKSKIKTEPEPESEAKTEPSPNNNDDKLKLKLKSYDYDYDYGHLVESEYLPNLDRTAYSCKEHPKEGPFYELEGILESHFKPFHNHNQAVDE
jgi:DNA replicative helicase MCM subunit Mcm2 (Cdc46/Mcm family)